MMKKTFKRRDFFKIAATSGAAAALASCNKDPVEKLLPDVFPPDNYKVEVPWYFASICKECPIQCGIVVKTREARAIKVEGNPNHPLNQGKLCAVGQSSLQSLYNPSRIKKALIKNQPVNYQEAKDAFLQKITALAKQKQGSKVLILHAGGDSSLQRMIAEISNTIGAKNLAVNFNSANSIRKANEILFNKAEIPDYNIDKADFLLNFGADFLETWINPLKFSREFSDFTAYKKRKKKEYTQISPHLSISGVPADYWISCPSQSEEAIALSLINALINKRNSLSASERKIFANYSAGFSIDEVAQKYNIDKKRLTDVVDKLANKKSLVIGGGNVNANGNQTKLQVAIAILNYITQAEKNNILQFGADYKIAGDSLAEVQKNLQLAIAGKYKALVLLDLNLDYMFSSFPDIEKIYKNTSVISLSLANNETSKKAEIVLPITSSFEDWGDSFIRNGIYALQQPVMAKLPNFDAKPAGDLFLELGKKLALKGDFANSKSFADYLKKKWRKVQTDLKNKDTFQNFWKKSLQKGGFFRDYQPTKAKLKSNINLAKSNWKEVSKLSLIALNSNMHYSNGNTGDKYWLLEIPHPMTQVVWDSWLEIHPETAVQLGIDHKDELEVTTNQGKFKLGAYIYNFIDKNTLAMPTGLGRKIQFPNYSARTSILTPFTKDNRKNLIGKKVGENSLEILPFSYDEAGDYNFLSEGIRIKKTGRKFNFVEVDGQYKSDIVALKKDFPADYGDRSQKHRHLYQEVSIKELNTGKVKKEGHHFKPRYYTTDTQGVSDFYKEKNRSVSENIFGVQGNKTPKYYDPYKFEMSIDLNKCTGCSACVVACYAENNIAVVGKERQAVGREMSWIRIERYIDKDKKTGKLKALLSPQMCQQCGNAGCEAVCPVYATYHNPDGLNAQIYNRCVGTRYCANNCIYKQRRFNWRTYSFPSPLNLQLNPDVSVRDKGVMEKCTFCVQRIRDAKSKAKDENRIVFDGEIKTACQQTCPTDAIVFGNAMDNNSQVTKARKNIRGYHQLEEVNFQPSVTYLKKIIQS